MSLFTFFIAATILAITPGPGIAYVVARTAAGGRSAGLASCAGTGIGGFVHVLAAALGLSLLITQSAWAFSVLKYIGAVYLIYLGVNMLRRPVPTPDTQPDAQAQGVLHVFLEGVLVETSNIKTAIFFLAFLPQFIDPEASPVLQLILLGSICVAMNTFVDVLAVLWANRLLNSNAIQSVKVRLLNRISGSVLIVLGVVLATVQPDR